MTVEDLRGQFPHTRSRIYLNHAATAPLSRVVREAIEQRLSARQGEGIDDFPAFLDRLARTRRRAAQLLGAEPEQVAFTANTSDGLNLLAGGIQWEEGDRVAVPGCEFPANVYPFLQLERRGVEVDFVPHREGCVSLESVAETITSRTRLLSISWVQFLSGDRADLAALSELCEERNVRLCVDAIQGLGALELDVERSGVDFLAAGTHKWLMGTQGLGLVYVSERLLDDLVPSRAGWTHGPVDWDDLFDYRLTFHPDASRYEIGTQNAIGIQALDAALGLYFEFGTSRCEDRVLALTGRLAHGLAERGLERYGPARTESGIVSVRHPDPEGLREFLADRDVTVAVRNGLVRCSPTYYNTRSEIDRVLDLVGEFGRSGP